MIHHMNVWNVAQIYFAGPEYKVFLTNLVSFFFFFFNPFPKVLGDKYGNAVSFHLTVQ